MARIKTPASIRSNAFPAIKLGSAAVKVAVSAVSAAAAAVAANVTCVRVVADTNCHISVNNPAVAATVADHLLPSFKAEYFNVNPGDVITVIRDTADGSLYISAAEIG